MQTNVTSYDVGETTSLRLQILIVTRVLHCVLIVTRASYYVVKTKCQLRPMKIPCTPAEWYIGQECTGLVIVSCLKTWLVFNLVV